MHVSRVLQSYSDLIAVTKASSKLASIVADIGDSAM